MRSQPFVLGAIALVALLSSLLTAHFAPAEMETVIDPEGNERLLPRVEVDDEHAAIARRAEVDRVRAHLLAAEQHMRANRGLTLAPEQRQRRSAAILAIAEYRARGDFPHNTDFPSQRVPYFVDADGTLCALAFLMVRTGRRDLVNRLAATHNHAYVDELAGMADLREWLAEEGLTLDDAARIQPTHGPTLPR